MGCTGEKLDPWVWPVLLWTDHTIQTRVCSHLTTPSVTGHSYETLCENAFFHLYLTLKYLSEICFKNLNRDIPVLTWTVIFTWPACLSLSHQTICPFCLRRHWTVSEILPLPFPRASTTSSPVGQDPTNRSDLLSGLSPSSTIRDWSSRDLTV